MIEPFVAHSDVIFSFIVKQNDEAIHLKENQLDCNIIFLLG